MSYRRTAVTAETAVTQTVAVSLLKKFFSESRLTDDVRDWLRHGLRKHVLTGRPLDKCLGLKAPAPGYDATRSILLKTTFEEQIFRLWQIMGSPYYGKTKLMAPMMDVLNQIDRLMKAKLDQGLSYDISAEAIICPPGIDPDAFSDCCGYLIASLIPPDGPVLPKRREVLAVILAAKAEGKDRFAPKKTAISGTVKNKKPPEFADGKDRRKFRLIRTK